jgi:hypothetical protein
MMSGGVSEEFGMLEGYGVLEVLRELAANCRGRWRNLMLLGAVVFPELRRDATQLLWYPWYSRQRAVTSMVVACCCLK